MSKSASQSFDELQGSTIDQLAEILRHLRQPLNPDGARVAVRAQFEAHLTAMKDRLKTIKDKFPGVPRPIKYGSDWIFKEITPLETNVSRFRVGMFEASLSRLTSPFHRFM